MSKRPSNKPYCCGFPACPTEALRKLLVAYGAWDAQEGASQGLQQASQQKAALETASKPKRRKVARRASGGNPKGPKA
jgi:hypothetical protein